jgi:hypothetical protein
VSVFVRILAELACCLPGQRQGRSGRTIDMRGGIKVEVQHYFQGFGTRLR